MLVVLPAMQDAESPLGAGWPDWIREGGRTAAAARLGRPATRLAPSPTGHWHIGHVGHMLYVWGVAALLDGDVILRMENHDRQRSKAEFEVGLAEDLEWLGFEPSNPDWGESARYRQSSSGAAYESALQHLRTHRTVYRCDCTRKRLTEFRVGSPSAEPRYPGFCRNRDLDGSAPHGLRLSWSDDRSVERFEDGLLGAQEQRPDRQCGDLLLRDRLAQWTYQFSVTVDDTRHGIDFVVRGEDLLASTGRQIRLARYLGRTEPPRYFHHPLVVDSDGVKLSKRQRPPTIRGLKRAGVTREAVLGEAARRIGLAKRARCLLPEDAADLVAARYPEVFAGDLAGSAAANTASGTASTAQ